MIAGSITQSAKARPGARRKCATATADGAEGEKAPAHVRRLKVTPKTV